MVFTYIETQKTTPGCIMYTLLLRDTLPRLTGEAGVYAAHSKRNTIEILVVISSSPLGNIVEPASSMAASVAKAI